MSNTASEEANSKTSGPCPTLSISSSVLPNCEKVIRKLKKAGIVSSVAPIKSVRCNYGQCRCWVERGCRITLEEMRAKDIKSKVWVPFEKEFHLGCAHLSVPGQYEGCIHDFQSKK
jgi:hypothetical protein